MLDAALDLLEALGSRENLGPEERKLIRMERADTYGMKGGVYRRLGQEEKALDMYEEGLKEEEKDKESTYNLVNTITLAVSLGRSNPTDPRMVDLLQGE